VKEKGGNGGKICGVRHRWRMVVEAAD